MTEVSPSITTTKKNLCVKITVPHQTTKKRTLPNVSPNEETVAPVAKKQRLKSKEEADEEQLLKAPATSKLQSKLLSHWKTAKEPRLTAAEVEHRETQSRIKKKKKGSALPPSATKMTTLITGSSNSSSTRKKSTVEEMEEDGETEHDDTLLKMSDDEEDEKISGEEEDNIDVNSAETDRTEQEAWLGQAASRGKKKKKRRTSEGKKRTSSSTQKQQPRPVPSLRPLPTLATELRPQQQHLQSEEEEEKSTIIIEDASSLAIRKKSEKNLKRQEQREKRRKEKKTIQVDIDEEDDEDEDEEPLVGHLKSYCTDEEGSYVRMVPLGLESKLVQLAKQGSSQSLQSAGVNELMRVDKSVYCNDIRQDALANKNYIDKDKVNVDYLADNKRANHSLLVAQSWIEDDFQQIYETTETMNLLDEFETVESVLTADNARKGITAKTVLDDLPRIEASYILDHLREPILDLHERQCIGGYSCVSYYLMKYISMNTPLHMNSKFTTSTTTTTAASTGITTTINRPLQKGPEALREMPPTATSRGSNVSTTATTTTTTTTPPIHSMNGIDEQCGFILREFLLPAQKRQLEEAVALGTPIKEALQTIERKHCILCNRYLTTTRACRISAGIRELPTNTIQDHKNFFNLPGEYPLEERLQLSNDYCGIIGEMVAFNTKNYAPAIIEYRYNTTTAEERNRGILHTDAVVKLRSWVEKNLISSPEKHQEGARR